MPLLHPAVLSTVRQQQQLSTVRQQQQLAAYYAQSALYTLSTINTSVRCCCHRHWPMYARTIRSV